MNAAPLPSLIPHFGDLQPWAQSTFYALSQRVTANGNIYQCTTQGTSSGAGTGPSGNGGSIADGGVVWAFQAAISTAWTALTAYALGDVVTNDGGKLYECITAGTSAGSGGPTGTAGVITDGSVTWTYIAVVAGQQTQPTSRTGDIGAVPGGRAFAQYFNWWFAKILLWIYFVRDMVAQLRIQPTIADTAPVATFADQAGKVRTLIDHNGYLLGRVCRLHEDWFNEDGTSSTVSAGAQRGKWTNSSVGTGTVSYNGPNSAVGFPLSPYVSIGPTTANNDSTTWATITTAFPPFAATAAGDALIVAEWEMSLNAVGANHFTVFVGFASALDFAAAGDYAYVTKATGDTNWKFIHADAVGGAITAVDLGVTPAQDVADRFKLELVGANALGGKRIRVFVNDVLRADLSTNTAKMPSSNNMKFGAEVLVTTAATTALLRLSPLDVEWNRYLSAPMV